ncbi:unnamed protein product [Amoebophrya sp. A120]|nr:unnamed protein product [Amoebophrya sp. A120]|eukprot:GSA120T00012226001.1
MVSTSIVTGVVTSRKKLRTGVVVYVEPTESEDVDHGCKRQRESVESKAPANASDRGVELSCRLGLNVNTTSTIRLFIARPSATTGEKVAVAEIFDFVPPQAAVEERQEGAEEKLRNTARIAPEGEDAKTFEDHFRLYREKVAHTHVGSRLRIRVDPTNPAKPAELVFGDDAVCDDCQVVGDDQASGKAAGASQLSCGADAGATPRLVIGTEISGPQSRNEADGPETTQCVEDESCFDHSETSSDRRLCPALRRKAIMQLLCRRGHDSSDSEKAEASERADRITSLVRRIFSEAMAQTCFLKDSSRCTKPRAISGNTPILPTPKPKKCFLQFRHEPTEADLQDIRAAASQSRESQRINRQTVARQVFSASGCANETDMNSHGEKISQPASATVADGIEATSKHRRAHCFAKWIVETYQERLKLLDRKTSIILDVAGGTGDLSVILRSEYGFENVFTVDPWKPEKWKKWQLRKIMNVSRQDQEHGRRTKTCGELSNRNTTTELTKESYQAIDEYTEAAALLDRFFVREKFDFSSAPSPKLSSLIQNCDLIVGLHPDQATEPIVAVAGKLRKPMCVVPCCVFADQFPERRLKVVEADRKEERQSNLLCDDDEEGDFGLVCEEAPASAASVVSEEEPIVWQPVRDYPSFLKYLRQRYAPTTDASDSVHKSGFAAGDGGLGNSIECAALPMPGKSLVLYTMITTSTTHC